MWLLSKAFNNKVPENLKEPFYRDHEVCISTYILSLIFRNINSIYDINLLKYIYEESCQSWTT